MEGAKNVLEVIQSDWKVRLLLATDDFVNENKSDLSGDFKVEQVKPKELEGIGSFQSNDSAIAVLEFRDHKIAIDEKEFILAYDEIKDPGNLGTIIRIADWYGLKQIICSENSVDMYNPKVINSSMGSFLRVNVIQANLKSFLEETKAPVYGFYLEGDNIHELTKLEPGILLFGNESKGIDGGYDNLIRRKLSIPKFGGAESLNVAVSTAVATDNLMRLK
ncbi:MAG: RNA methyltransferase [Bacteroidota bacterium]